MLSILLLLAAAPQAQSPVIVAAPMHQPAPPTNMPVLGGVLPGCSDRPTPVDDPITPGAGLMWRETGEPVALYRLLERRIDGCPAPVIVNYRVPGSNAVGRELGRAAAPGPLAPPRP